jgi:hypothetical protein
MADQHRGSTAAQLKDDINSGRTGDKIRAFDPAAAPLGTDEEAAGTPTPASAIEAERRMHAERNATRRLEPGSYAGNERRPLKSPQSYWLAAAIAATLIIAGVAFVL